jgi:hypothetical protein
VFGRRKVKKPSYYQFAAAAARRRRRTVEDLECLFGWLNEQRASRSRFRVRSVDSRLIGERSAAGRCARCVVRRPTRSNRDSYLVDPASSHMLVSKIKPCMSKHKLLNSEAANGSLGHPLFLGSYNPTWITVVILELIHASKLRPFGERARLLDQNQSVLRVRTFGDSG